MSIEEAAELARRSIYHATFRDGASGGVASGMLSLPLIISCIQNMRHLSHNMWTLHIVREMMHTQDAPDTFSSLFAHHTSMITIWFELVLFISLLCGTWWMEEALRWWCWRTSLPLLSSYAEYSGTRNGWSTWGIKLLPNLDHAIDVLTSRDGFQDMITRQKLLQVHVFPVGLWNNS